MKKIKVISCLVTLGIMALIFFFSSQNSTESSAVSGTVTQKVVDIIASVTRIPAEQKPQMVLDMHNLMRKTAHFIIYMTLGASSYVSIKLVSDKGRVLCGISAAVWSMLYAATDEAHQLFVSGRGGRVSDVFLDTAGAVTGVLILLAVCSLCLNKLIKRGGAG